MKTFCTEGPVDPARNYFVSRKSLLKQGLAKLDAFMRVYVNKNISNVVNKARQYPEIMMQVLFDGPINFTAYNEQLSFLRVNGVIDIHPEGSRGEERVDGVRLHWWILPVNVTPPSRC